MLLLKVWEFVWFCIRGRRGTENPNNRVTYYVDDPKVIMSLLIKNNFINSILKLRIKWRKKGREKLFNFHEIWCSLWEMKIDREKSCNKIMSLYKLPASIPIYSRNRCLWSWTQPHLHWQGDAISRHTLSVWLNWVDLSLLNQRFPHELQKFYYWLEWLVEDADKLGRSIWEVVQHYACTFDELL